jgi:hypothetical protein
MLFPLLIGGAAAIGSYGYAKKKQASTGQSAAAAAVGGAAGWGATALTLWAVMWMWPVFLVSGAVAGAYYLGKKKQQKALPPAA